MRQPRHKKIKFPCFVLTCRRQALDGHVSFKIPTVRGFEGKEDSTHL